MAVSFLFSGEVGGDWSFSDGWELSEAVLGGPYRTKF